MALSMPSNTTLNFSPDNKHIIATSDHIARSALQNVLRMTVSHPDHFDMVSDTTPVIGVLTILSECGLEDWMVVGASR